MCLFNLGFVVFSVCLSVVCYSTNEMEIEREREREGERGEGKRENITRNIFCRLPLGFYDYSLHASSCWVQGVFWWGARGFRRVQLLQPLSSKSRLDPAEPPAPRWKPPATWKQHATSYFSTEFEKVVFTKVLALAMFYLVLFENWKKLIFKLSMGIFGQSEHRTNWLDPGHFLRSNFRGLFFLFFIFFNKCYMF